MPAVGYNHRVRLQLNVSQLSAGQEDSRRTGGSYSCYIMRNMKDNSQQSFPLRRQPQWLVSLASQHFLHYPAAGRTWCGLVPVKSQSIIQQLFYHLENNNTGDDVATARPPLPVSRAESRSCLDWSLIKPRFTGALMLIVKCRVVVVLVKSFGIISLLWGGDRNTNLILRSSVMSRSRFMRKYVSDPTTVFYSVRSICWFVDLQISRRAASCDTNIQQLLQCENLRTS